MRVSITVLLFFKEGFSESILFFSVLSDGRNKSMRGFDKRANITIAKYMFVYLIINCNID